MADSIDTIRERTLEADLERYYGHAPDNAEWCYHCERRTNNKAQCPDCGRGPYCRKCVTAMVECRRCNMPIDRSGEE